MDISIEYDYNRAVLSGTATLFIKTARKLRAFKPGDEWPPAAQPAKAGEAEEIVA